MKAQEREKTMPHLNVGSAHFSLFLSLPSFRSGFPNTRTTDNWDHKLFRSKAEVSWAKHNVDLSAPLAFTQGANRSANAAPPQEHTHQSQGAVLMWLTIHAN